MLEVIVGVMYYIGLLFFFIDKRSPFREWSESNLWISLPLFFILSGIGFFVILK